MAPRKTSKRSKARTTDRRSAPKVSSVSGPGPIRRWWDGLGSDGHRRIGLGLLNFFVVCVLVLLAAGGLYRLNRWINYSEDGPVSQKSQARILLVNAPQWMSENLASSVCYDLTAGAMVEVYDDQLTTRVGQRALSCPWIESLGRVVVEFSDLEPAAKDQPQYCIVVVTANYRYPMAIVEDNRSWAYVDHMGSVLPAEQAAELRGPYHTIRIIGTASGLPAAGELLQGDDVTAALTLVETFQQKPYYSEITLIDVSNYNFRKSFSDPQIVIHAVSGQHVTQLRFGAFPVGGLPPAGEPTVDQKFANLDKWFIENGNMISGPSFLDLRYPDHIVKPNTY